MNECGAAVEIVGLGLAGRVAQLCEESGIPWWSFPVRLGGGRGRTLATIVRFARRLRGLRAEAVVPYTLVPNVLCTAGRPITRTRFVFWNQRDAGAGSVGRRIESWAIRRADCVVANSIAGAEFLAQRLGIRAAMIQIVPNGVESQAAREGRQASRARLGLAEEAFAVTMVANLHANKDHATLLRAWRIALDRWPLAGHPGVLLLAGRPGGTEPALQRLAAELSLSGDVRFLGAVEDVAGLLAASDLGAFSSVREGCPNGVLECMAAGLAVVATDIPSVRDVLGPEGMSLLAPPGDAGTFAERIVAAAGGEALRAALGAANRRRAGREYSAERMCETMAGLIATGLA